MNKSALQDIQQALNAIRGEIERVDDETKWAALELMLSTSSSVVALAKKMTKPETKAVTRTVAVPKTKIVKQQTPPQTTPKDTERKDFTPIRPQPPLPNQQDSREKR
ncbi:hypothetical protein N9Z25_07595 [Luminiphilus sp.]|nr:hypothetical protein [Luminiphilus sp.]